MQTLRGGWGGGGYGSRGGGYGGGSSRSYGDDDYSPAYGSGRRGEQGGTGSRGGRSDLTSRQGEPRTPSFGKAAERPDVPVLAVGDRVTHDSYGMGTVVALEGAGSSSVAKIDFGSGGTKRLLLRYSPVVKL